MPKDRNHTPGPWHRSFGNHVYTDRGSLIATCTPLNGDRDTLQEVFANAKLIAAAPDLLRALQHILSAHESGNNGACTGEAVLCEAFALEARAAIYKATDNP
jgi:hypothetical protein